LSVIPAAWSPRGGLYAMAVRPVANYEDQAANGNQRKNQPIHQFERRRAVAGKHRSGHRVFVEQKLVNRIEPMENGEQRDEVEQPAIGPSHSGVPGQQEKTAPNRKPGQPRADLERENSQDEQDDSDGDVFARKAPDDRLQA
jgi:hypothetical protein